MSSLKEKVVLVTGAGCGIGAQVARHFAAKGSYLSLTDFRVEDLQRTAQDCINIGVPEDKILTVFGDLSDPLIQEKVVNQTVEKFGQLDVLLNIAGRFLMKSLEQTSYEDMDALLSINVKSVFNLTRLCVQHLKASKGNVVNVSSISAQRPSKGFTAYCMTKGAISNLTMTTAYDLAEYGVRVNCVSPGTIETDILLHAGVSKEHNDNIMRQGSFSRCIPLGRNGTTDDVAKVMAFLASDDAAYVTGVQLLVDGGFSLHLPSVNTQQ